MRFTEKRMHIKFVLAGWILAMAFGKLSAQHNLGTAGLLNAPSAEMNETGTFMIGGNYMPAEMNPFSYNTGNYFVNFTLFSWMELTYRETLLKTTYMTEKAKFNQQDRSFSVRVRPLKESKYIPAVVIGTNDPYRDLGKNYYRAIYGTATKHFLIKGHELAVTVGYMGWTGDQNAMRNGCFGGIAYRPSFCKQLRIIAEYDTREVNLGLTAKFWNRLSLHAFTSGFDCMAGGIRYECTLIH